MYQSSLFSGSKKIIIRSEYDSMLLKIFSIQKEKYEYVREFSKFRFKE